MTDQPYTGGPDAPTPAAVDPAPVKTAVTLMFARAALTILGFLVGLTQQDALRTAVRKANPNVDVDAAVKTALTVTIVLGIIFVVLYILLALQVRKGRNWARIVTWVVAGLGVLGGLASLAGTGTAIGKVLAVVVLVLDIAIIALLARPAASAYFRARSAHP